MDFDQTIVTLNTLLQKKKPENFGSSWILKHAPHCYHFIQRNVRMEIGGIDWDRVTYALEWKYQRRWTSSKPRKNVESYEDRGEVETIIKTYGEKLYVFITAPDLADRRIRDIIAVTLVRLAQRGNLLAKQEVMKLVRYTIDEWIDRYYSLSRWKGYDDEIQEQLAACIRRYRYTGSFITYTYRTFEYAGRGLKPIQAYSLDEPILNGEKRKIDLIGQDPETNEIKLYTR
jgi:hypothetical protein